MTSHLVDQTQQLTAEALVDLQTPADVCISPSGRKVVYSLTPSGRYDAHPVSSLWIATVGKEYSARQRTSGLFYDTLLQWSPDGKYIAFISYRAKRGESSAICLLPIEPIRGGEPYPVTRADNKKKITAFSWSPDGRFISFLSPDEKSVEQENKEKGGDDAKIYGGHWENNRLRCLHVGTLELSVLFAKEAHVHEHAWSEDSAEIAYAVHKTPDVTSPEDDGILFERVSLLNKETTAICDFPGPIRALVWFNERLFFLAGAMLRLSNTSSIVYSVSLDDKVWTRSVFGYTTGAVGLRPAAKSMAIQVQSGLSDQIDLMDGRIVYDEPHEISTWDVHTTNKGSIITVGKSSGSSLTEIYSVEGDVVCQLSQHGTAIASLQIADAQSFFYRIKDDICGDGVLLSPSKANNPKPWPTVVLIHGGLYSRVSVGFDLPSTYHWGPWLTSAGYAVLCPNYRGGSSRSEWDASGARGKMRTRDYEDIISMVKQGIAEGIVGEQKVAIGGWSYGGFLSSLAVTRPDFHFRAAICGGGVANWDMMSKTSSDAPLYEAELAGGEPRDSNMDDTRSRHASDVWNVKNVKTPILILHGEDDVCVPLTEAIAFHRGCLHHGIPCEFVTYPREEHESEERLHLIDQLRRVRRFCDLHLKP
ncbi:MAG: hypothetical protein Q9187_005418 [Circinaria calcarea]